jgi:hypothetical protein
MIKCLIIKPAKKEPQMGLVWQRLDPRAHPDMLGFIPMFLSDSDPRPAREQFDSNYSHGGGWDKFDGFKLLPDGQISYPGDPPIPPLFRTVLRNEIITVYDCAWVMIMQLDGSWEIARLD